MARTATSTSRAASVTSARRRGEPGSEYGEAWRGFIIEITPPRSSGSLKSELTPDWHREGDAPRPPLLPSCRRGVVSRKRLDRAAAPPVPDTLPRPLDWKRTRVRVVLCGGNRPALVPGFLRSPHEIQRPDLGPDRRRRFLDGQEAADQLLIEERRSGVARRSRQYRADHWTGVTVVVLRSCWPRSAVGTRPSDEQQRATAEAKGVGRIFPALCGDERAADKLVLLLKDQSKAVRLQSARALAVLDDEDVNPTLLRIVRYWPGNDKLELIDVLRKENDIRVGKVLKEFTHDRNPMVARKALTALAIVGHVSKGVTKDEDERRRGRVKRARKPSRPEVTAGDAAALARPGASSVAEATGRAGKSGEGAAIAVSVPSTRDRRSPRRTTSASPQVSARPGLQRVRAR